MSGDSNSSGNQDWTQDKVTLTNDHGDVQTDEDDDLMKDPDYSAESLIGRRVRKEFENGVYHGVVVDEWFSTEDGKQYYKIRYDRKDDDTSTSQEDMSEAEVHIHSEGVLQNKQRRKRARKRCSNATKLRSSSATSKTFFWKEEPTGWSKSTQYADRWQMM